jgi:predicted secreted protein
MAYGGLRGAVGFSLVEMINKEVVPPKMMFVTTMLATVVFTVFFQVSHSCGRSCKPFFSIS